uniref:6-phosphofructo-2-kinase domain-containing protein n=1 Tax=Aplanochytrium stocchinoi TaxID=215587 RepID=A0A7S3V1U2_9STRA|mmetsp:Transcript_2119/g.3031  ORF Transcript_2119/g.3031 Transcript_2119/m.3031 type:complete len:527 (+) Transcript_2119:119-1699(+)|eukprot:CAMPEP_0204860440 /NCGR_PEP_ID=MMETSP1348-20121228/399_1 /ASSEMBLY_ACC=CAM_ASM_000700 /TAXON_ID=215587 /ORGANISM="Aplanochytrium stocchinoi, Strain GSBS06" /LENGTH=526 /DNA_ID=CAMNT_0052009137 /DNA_START=422 /DNA_END=2002 /DNA_ORIENTATION=-
MASSYSVKDMLLRQTIAEKVVFKTPSFANISGLDTVLSSSDLQNEKTKGRQRKVSIPKSVARIAGTPLVIVMCGLPARGKSYTSKKLCTYLSWVGFNVKTFNAGNKRREMMSGGGQSSDFFGAEGTSTLDYLASLAFNDLIAWLHKGGHVAVFDATNTTRERRIFLIDRCKECHLPPPLFIECICTDKVILEKNYRLKLGNNDYKDWDPEEAMKDFLERVKRYETRYQTIGEVEEDEIEDLKYIKNFNVGKKMIVNNCTGWLSSQIVSILQNFHVSPRRILLCRHGESEDYVLDKIGGDSALTKNGKDFAIKLRDFVEKIRHQSPKSNEDMDSEWDGHDRCCEVGPLVIFSSGLQRSLETIRPLRKLNKRPNWDQDERACFPFDGSSSDETENIPPADTDIDIFTTTALNEISAGVFDGMTYSEIKKTHPEQYAARINDKVSYRYPGGESYMDVVQRLQPIVHELERQKSDVLVVCHTAPIRLLLAYFLGKPVEDFVDEAIPMHSVFEIRPRAYGCDLIKHDLLTE